MHIISLRLHIIQYVRHRSAGLEHGDWQYRTALAGDVRPPCSGPRPVQGHSNKESLQAVKIVLGYSGGLDTSVIVPWLRENYRAEVICMAADVGQWGGVDRLATKAFATGASAFFGEDLKEEFLTDYILPVLRAGAVYSRKYLLGTAMARPVISRRMVEIARRTGADTLAHGCTGKGNDQLRFELSFAALAPDLKVVAPWREWDITSREDAFAYARAWGISLEGIDAEKLYSRDENLWHISHEGGPLEDPANAPGPDVFVWTRDPLDAPDTPAELELGFEAGVPVSIDGRPMSLLALLTDLNEVGSEHGVGRADVVEDRVVGIKSRGVYETPGGTILLTALQELEQLVLSRSSLALKDALAPRYADLVYEGRWWTPEREAIDATVDSLMANVTGTVRLRLFKGQATVLARQAPVSLYDLDLASFGASEGYAHADASGFVKLFTLPQRAVAAQQRVAAGRTAGNGRGELEGVPKHAPFTLPHPVPPTVPPDVSTTIWRPAAEVAHAQGD